MQRFYWITVLLLGSMLTAYAQMPKPMMMKPKAPIICYGKKEDQHVHIPPPEEYQRLANAGARVQTATFNVTYVGFEGSPDAKAAFQKAVDIWATLIDSPVPINIRAEWQPLDGDVLGAAIWGTVHANFNGAQRINTWYPAALAEKMAGEELNDDEPDVYAFFNSTLPEWDFDPNVAHPGEYSFVTVVLHEIGHGLGFVDSYTVSGSQGVVGVQDTGVPMIFDAFIQNGSGQNLLTSFDSPSAALATQLTSQSLFFSATTVTNAKLYAPSTFDGGSSVAHLDELTYNGTANALMTPSIGTNESILDPGLLVKNAFADMGWTYTRINHTALRDQENTAGPYQVKAVITSENGPVASPTLVYTIGAGDVEVAMTPTGTANEYAANIPGAGAGSYGYFIRVDDASGRTFTNPGKLINRTENTQFYFTFSTGTDTEAPVISHVPKSFVLTTDTQLKVDADISDNAYLAATTIEYAINEVTQTPINMSAVTAEVSYTGTINVAGLSEGDIVKYRIMATDNAAAPNSATDPATGFHEVNVVALAATQDNYSNNFNSASSDFFGTGFSVTTPSGFADGAIHSIHPYVKGEGQPNEERNYTYQLRIPIRIAETDATIKFDEIVLVEPGETGTTFGDPEFYDYVVVEGSIDGGVNWTPIADGYDSRDNSEWLSTYNSAITDNNSTATGTPAMYKSRTIDMLASGDFDPGDEIVIRFRLFSDQLAVGWGWAIDNVKIQIDDQPPVIQNDHFDFVLDEDEVLPIRTKVTDVSGVQSHKIEFRVNDGSVQEFEFPVSPSADEYTLDLDISGLDEGDLIEYRIRSSDNNGNEAVFPATGFIQVPVMVFGTPVNTYANDFNSATTDFVGNFFSVTTVSGFSNGAIHSTHTYPAGFGLLGPASLTYTLKKPIIVNGSNPFIRFDEVVIVEGHAGGAAFGTAAFKDYVVVEGSKDGGNAWLPLADGYDAVSNGTWLSTFNAKGN
ncbi:MAG: hypothetical protein HC859_03230, partial [Bacteroidia bacterium]|nr:hypothetical protein [Bacteroidia bacterium]